MTRQSPADRKEDALGQRLGIMEASGRAWMSAVVSSGQRVSRRDLDPAPTTYVSPAASRAARSSK